MLISIREYARQRGVSHTAVNKAVRAGKIPLVNGKIDPAAADAAWERNRDARQPSGITGDRQATAAHRPDPPAAGPRRDPSDGPRPGTLAHAQLAHTTAKAKQAMLKAQQMEGKLTDVGAINSWVAGMIIRAATILDRIPDEMADRLAQESDPANVKLLLGAELRRARAELAEYRV